MSNKEPNESNIAIDTKEQPKKVVLKKDYQYQKEITEYVIKHGLTEQDDSFIENVYTFLSQNDVLALEQIQEQFNDIEPNHVELLLHKLRLDNMIQGQRQGERWFFSIRKFVDFNWTNQDDQKDAENITDIKDRGIVKVNEPPVIKHTITEL